MANIVNANNRVLCYHNLKYPIQITDDNNLALKHNIEGFTILRPTMYHLDKIPKSLLGFLVDEYTYGEIQAMSINAIRDSQNDQLKQVFKSILDVIEKSTSRRQAVVEGEFEALVMTMLTMSYDNSVHQNATLLAAENKEGEPIYLTQKDLYLMDGAERYRIVDAVKKNFLTEEYYCRYPEHRPASGA